jgi:hypothetical protein
MAAQIIKQIFDKANPGATDRCRKRAYRAGFIPDADPRLGGAHFAKDGIASRHADNR